MPKWIMFKLIERPCYDQDGNILQSIEGRRNRKGIDEINGGGKVYPNLKSVKVLERYEKDGNLMVLADGDTTELEQQGAVTFQASPKIMFRESAGFQPQVVDEVEVETLKETVFDVKKPIIVEECDSGVTK